MRELAQYPNGCSGCGGACCRRQLNGVPPWNADEWARLDSIISHEDATLHRFLQASGVPERCLMLDEDGLCRIHDRKPQDCRNAQVGGEDHCIPSRKLAGLPV